MAKLVFVGVRPGNLQTSWQHAEVTVVGEDALEFRLIAEVVRIVGHGLHAEHDIPVGLRRAQDAAQGTGLSRGGNTPEIYLERTFVDMVDRAFDIDHLGDGRTEHVDESAVDAAVVLQFALTDDLVAHEIVHRCRIEQVVVVGNKRLQLIVREVAFVDGLGNVDGRIVLQVDLPAKPSHVFREFCFWHVILFFYMR